MDLRLFDEWFRNANGDAAEPQRITPTDLREYKSYLVKERCLRPNSVNRKLAVLRSFLGWAANAGLIPDGRAPSIPRSVAQVRPGPRWLGRRERLAFMRAIERAGRPRDAAIVTMLLHTGLRVRELCALCWRDVTLRPRAGVVVVHGKGNKLRTVPLNLDVRNALQSMGFAEKAGSPEPIFHGQRGPLTARGVQSMLAKYSRAAGLDDVSPHSLRHTFCKDLADAGADLQEVAALAGHESLETTRRYCEPSMRDLQRTVALIEENA